MMVANLPWIFRTNFQRRIAKKHYNEKSKKLQELPGIGSRPARQPSFPSVPLSWLRFFAGLEIKPVL
jgi:hypothetical protein